ncbi:MAG TPA: hypothetical protein VF043_25125 [Ktedonobacteraceae bacterium]
MPPHRSILHCSHLFGLHHLPSLGLHAGQLPKRLGIAQPREIRQPGGVDLFLLFLAWLHFPNHQRLDFFPYPSHQGHKGSIATDDQPGCGFLRALARSHGLAASTAAPPRLLPFDGLGLGRLHAFVSLSHPQRLSSGGGLTDLHAGDGRELLTGLRKGHLHT